jgi:hypothetical protein
VPNSRRTTPRPNFRSSPGDAHAAPAGVVQRAERLVIAVVDVGEVAQLGR